MIALSLLMAVSVFVEAEDFSDRGGWYVDTQFVHKMGSAYLIAAGTEKPVADAVTTVKIPEAGTYRAWVRTKDWVPGFAPGKFTLSVGGTESCVLGASGMAGWRWEKAGEFALAAGEATVKLHDLTGYFGRCDAVLLTTDAKLVPPEGAEELEKFRCAVSGRSAAVADGGAYDVVVVGAGTTGMAAALAAARHGARTALINDRPVLGGNASDEFGVKIHGSSNDHGNAREGGIIEESKMLAAFRKELKWSGAFRQQAEAEPNLSTFTCQRVMKVEKTLQSITAVLAKNTLTGEWTRYRGKMFIDCTGDGWVGYYAGVPWRFGREGRAEHGEKEAPENADSMTMSGVVVGLKENFSNRRMVESSNGSAAIATGKMPVAPESNRAIEQSKNPKSVWCWQEREENEPVAYETPAWAKVLPEGYCRKRLLATREGHRGFHPTWWIEHSGEFDDFADPETARDELIRISFAFWGWGKNAWIGKDLLKNARLTWVPYTDARRETLRLMGDYVLTGNDQKQATVFPDRIAYGGWPMDTHDPLGIGNSDGDGYWREHPHLPIYTIPYRILYAPAFDNFFFAGRCSSVTHMALGSVRVESTLATLGQACGTAAAMCLAAGLTPRELGQRRIADLQRQLVKDGQYIPGVANDDPADFARGAKASASSSQDRLWYRRANGNRGEKGLTEKNRPHWRYATGASPAAAVDGWQRVIGNDAHAWVSAEQQPLPQWIRLDFEKPVKATEVRIAFDSDFNAVLPRALPDALAKDYVVEVKVGREGGGGEGGEWRRVAEVRGNWRQLVSHKFDATEISAVRVTVSATYGDPSARIFEIRVY